MIDNLFYQLGRLPMARLRASRLIKACIPGDYAALTMHRPSNVDDKKTLARLLGVFHEITAGIPMIFPCHPRTLKRINEFGFLRYCKTLRHGRGIENGLVLTEPLGYMDFLNLWKDAKCVITDSGGVQEETTALKIPCITIRENTERPVTASVGSNVVVGRDTDKIKRYFRKAVCGQWKKSRVPRLWDGRASERIVRVLAR